MLATRERDGCAEGIDDRLGQPEARATAPEPQRVRAVPGDLDPTRGRGKLEAGRVRGAHLERRHGLAVEALETEHAVPPEEPVARDIVQVEARLDRRLAARVVRHPLERGQGHVRAPPAPRDAVQVQAGSDGAHARGASSLVCSMGDAVVAQTTSRWRPGPSPSNGPALGVGPRSTPR